MTDNYIVIYRPVKHARIRVSEDNKVRLIVPEEFSTADIDALLLKKRKWIEKNLKFFADKSRISLQRNQLLLFGNRYSYFYNYKFEHKVDINHQFKTINTKRDLLDKSIQEKWYKSVANKYLKSRTEELADSFNFDYNKIYIRSQRTKWGNCSTNNNISYNWRLIKAPHFVIDYLIIHELIHTRIKKHSSKFWSMLRSLYPEYREAIKWLEKYGNSL